MKGGFTVDNDSIKNNDTFQMQQTIIFLKSELMKYQNEVKKHENSDYYSLVINLEQENAHLKSIIKELTLDNKKLTSAFIDKEKEQQENYTLMEKQQLDHLNTIKALQRENQELASANKHLQDDLQTTHNKLTSLFQEKEIKDDSKTVLAIENLQLHIDDYTQEIKQQFRLIYEKIETLHKNLDEEDQLNQYLLLDNNEKNAKMSALLVENVNLKQQYDAILEQQQLQNNVNTIAYSQTLSHLDEKLRSILSESLHFEQQLFTKKRLLQQLEQKINELKNEIE